MKYRVPPPPTPMDVYIKPSDVYKCESYTSLVNFCEKHKIRVVAFRPPTGDDMYISASSFLGPRPGGFDDYKLLHTGYGCDSPRFIIETGGKWEKPAFDVWE